MGLTFEILGLVVFLGAHVFVHHARPSGLRSSQSSASGLIRVCFRWFRSSASSSSATASRAYRDAGPIPLWYPPAWTRQIVVALMWPASIMVAAAYIPGNIKRVLKHPMLVGVKTWAVAHLCANGDLGGIILFGSVLLWAVL